MTLLLPTTGCHCQHPPLNHCRPQPGATIILSPARLIHVHDSSPSYRLGHITDDILKGMGSGFFQTSKGFPD